MSLRSAEWRRLMREEMQDRCDSFLIYVLQPTLVHSQCALASAQDMTKGKLSFGAALQAGGMHTPIDPEQSAKCSVTATVAFVSSGEVQACQRPQPRECGKARTASLVCGRTAAL